MYLILDDVPVGSVITVGWSAVDRGVVSAVEEDIKNDRPGVDYTDANGMSRWCYLSQITSVSRRDGV
jgi:hypothetical protein